MWLDACDRASQTAAMQVAIQVERIIQAAPVAVFELALDPLRFPRTFRGFGPIPSIRAITQDGPPAVGSTRRLDNSDGSRPQELITSLDPPRHHAYTLSGLARPFSWLVREGHAEWTFMPNADGTRVRWRYCFELTAASAWLLAWPLLHVFMRGAMRRCLLDMQQLLENGGGGR